ncbi:winged helix family two component transcriptional regulator [Flammeovirgaceae bacterium 311]|nr:winged helix family two component transcriptional regulator [Flammeovirgaceae bacterium 311]
MRLQFSIGQLTYPPGTAVDNMESAFAAAGKQLFYNLSHKPSAMNKILVVEDDPTLNNNIKEALTEESMIVETAFDGLIAEKILKKTKYDCIIMDINVPYKNGYELCREFRKYNLDTPVLMLTAFDQIEDKVMGYDCGADDFLTKPFYMKELALRINSLLKRRVLDTSVRDLNATITAGDILIEPGNKKVSRQATEIMLTPREYQILLRLISARGEIVAKKDLIKEIWGNAVDTNTNTIEVYINFLRKKIDKPFNKDSIKTKIGFGYYFEEQ